MALTCTSSVYSGGTWAGWTDVPTIKIGGGGTGHGSYPHYAAGGGTAYVDCGAADNALVVSNSASGWVGNHETTIHSDDGLFAPAFVQVKLYNNARLSFSPFPGSSLPVIAATIGTVGGDGTGVFVIKSNNVVFMGSNGSFVQSHDAPTVSHRVVSAVERQVVTTQTLFTSSFELSGANICVEAGGRLDLPPNLYVCGGELVNRGEVTGVSSVEQCASTSAGGFFYDANPSGSQHCGSSTVSGKLLGCTNPSSHNYSPLPGTNEDNTCAPGPAGCTYKLAANYNPNAVQNDGSCTLPAGVRFGCTYKSATNFNDIADVDDGSCVFPVLPPAIPPSPPIPKEACGNDQLDQSAVVQVLSSSSRDGRLILRGRNPSIIFGLGEESSTCALTYADKELVTACPIVELADSSLPANRCSISYSEGKLMSSCPLHSASK